jgi:hypothetical protein
MAPPPKSDPFLADSQREVDAGAVFVLESKGKQKKNTCKNTWRDVFLVVWKLSQILQLL